VKPEINAVCTIFVAVIALVVIAASILTRRSEPRQQVFAY
jgi:ABC-type spermidine/putrescine transport system permease subunit II